MREKSPSPRARASILAPFPTHFRHQSKVKMATIVAQQLSAGCVGVSSTVSPSAHRAARRAVAHRSDIPGCSDDHARDVAARARSSVVDVRHALLTIVPGPTSIPQAHPEVPHRPPPRRRRQGSLRREGRGCRLRAPRLVPRHPAPAHLDGTLPCDYGFDPLNLGACLLSRNATERRVARAHIPSRGWILGGSITVRCFRWAVV